MNYEGTERAETCVSVMTQTNQTRVWVASAVNARDGKPVLLAMGPPLSGRCARPEKKSARVDY